MKHKAQHIGYSILLLFAASLSFSQEVSVRAGINRDKILIGEPVTIKLQAKVPAGTDAKWFPLDTLAHFEFVEKGRIDTAATADITTYTQQLTITSFDSGRWAVPALALTVGNREYLTDSFPVSGAWSNFDPKQDYHDIRDILPVENPSVKYINWAIAALALFSLLMVIWFLSKKKKLQQPVIKKVAPDLSPLQEALQSLDALHKRGFAQNGELKLFHSGLNDALRRFLYRKTSLSTMEKTSGELILQLQQTGLPKEGFVQLAQVLRVGDAVKFAKYRPGTEENEQSFTTIRNAIETLDKLIAS
jgi:hypothetical protein